MAYATNSDIQARIPHPTFGASTQPSTTQIDAWIAQAEARINVAVTAGGGTAPVTDANGILVLREAVAEYVAAITQRALDTSGGQAAFDGSEPAVQRFEALIADIRANPSQFDAEYSGGDAADTTRRLRSHVLDHPDGDSIAAGDFEPTFTRREPW